MTRASHRLGAVSLLVLAGLAATPAYAAGTASGTSITNTVTVNYSVASAAQTPVTASTTFAVDRKINLTVAEIGSTTTSVVTGQLAAATAFTVTNLSNAPLDFNLSAVNGAATHGGTDNFDVSNFKYYLDTDASGTFNAGDTQVTFLDELAADVSKTVFVVADVPSGRVANDVAGVFLTATGREGGSAGGTVGAALTNNSGTANTLMGVETVFADTASANGDGATNAAFTAGDDYTVMVALSAVKTSTVISDPFNNTTNPKMIPGATVEYCIALTNNTAVGSGFDATGLTLSDVLPVATTLVSGSIKKDGAVNGSGVCSGGTAVTDAVGYTSGTRTVSSAMADVLGGAKAALIFRVTIN